MMSDADPWQKFALISATLEEQGVAKESLWLIRQSHPFVESLGSGVAKCRSLDKVILKDHLMAGGLLHGFGTLAADWVATPVALHYVSPRVGSVLRWEWSEISSVRKRWRRLVTAKVEINLRDGTSMTWRLAASSAVRMVQITQDKISSASHGGETNKIEKDDSDVEEAPESAPGTSQEEN